MYIRFYSCRREKYTYQLADDFIHRRFPVTRRGGFFYRKVFLSLYFNVEHQMVSVLLDYNFFPCIGFVIHLKAVRRL
jgi:hypothetical protein